jgi:hypothetical protein
LKHTRFAGVALAFLLACSPVAGGTLDSVLLSPDDYVYLLKQGIERDHSVLQKMSPKELRQLHYVINDKNTETDPRARNDSIFNLLAHFEANQQWEKTHPGLLWDEKKGESFSEAPRY